MHECMAMRQAFLDICRYGVVLSKGISILRKSIHGLLEDAENGLRQTFRNLLARCYEQLVELDGHIDFSLMNWKFRVDKMMRANGCKRS